MYCQSLSKSHGSAVHRVAFPEKWRKAHSTDCVDSSLISCTVRLQLICDSGVIICSILMFLFEYQGIQRLISTMVRLEMWTWCATIYWLRDISLWTRLCITDDETEWVNKQLGPFHIGKNWVGAGVVSLPRPEMFIGHTEDFDPTSSWEGREERAGRAMAAIARPQAGENTQ